MAKDWLSDYEELGTVEPPSHWTDDYESLGSVAPEPPPPRYQPPRAPLNLGGYDLIVPNQDQPAPLPTFSEDIGQTSDYTGRLTRMGLGFAPAREAVGSLLEAGPRLLSPLARMAGEGDSADALLGEADRIAQAREQARTEDWSPWLSRMAGGAGTSLAQTLAVPGGVGAKILGASVMEGNEALKEASDAEMTPAGRLGYAIEQGVIEAVPATIANRLGFAPILKRLAGEGVAAKTWGELVRQVGKEGIKEIPEEIITEVGHNVARSWSGVDPEATTPETMLSTIRDTVAQTLLMSGMASTPNAARLATGTVPKTDRERVADFLDSPTRRKYEKLPEALRALYPLASESSQKDRESLAERMREDARSAGKQGQEQPPEEVAPETEPDTRSMDESLPEIIPGEQSLPPNAAWSDQELDRLQDFEGLDRVPPTNGEGVIQDATQLSEEELQGEGGRPEGLLTEPDAQVSTGAGGESAPVVPAADEDYSSLVSDITAGFQPAVNEGRTPDPLAGEQDAPVSATASPSLRASDAQVESEQNTGIPADYQESAQVLAQVEPVIEPPAALPAGPSLKSPQPGTPSPPMADDAGSAAAPALEKGREGETRVEAGIEQPLSANVAQIVRAQATPQLDIHREPTGWLVVSDASGTFLVHPTEDKVVPFPVMNPRSGTEVLRRKTEAQSWAIDNPIQPASPMPPSGDLIVSPLFENTTARGAIPSVVAGDQGNPPAPRTTAEETGENRRESEKTGAVPATPQFTVRDNDVFDQSGARVGAFLSPETAQMAAERWNRDGLPGAGTVAARSTQKKVPTNKKEPKAPNYRPKSLWSLVKAEGGIDPMTLRKEFNWKVDVVEGGLLGLVRKGGNKLDLLAEQLHREGHIRVPEDRNASDWLIEKLNEQSDSALFDYGKMMEADYAAYQQGLDDAERNHTPAEVAEAVRSGEEAGTNEGNSQSLEDVIDESLQIREDEVVDTSFDFGSESFSLQREPAKSDKPPPKKTQPDLWFESPADALVPKQEKPLPGQKTLPEPAEPRSDVEVSDAQRTTSAVPAATNESAGTAEPESRASQDRTGAGDAAAQAVQRPDGTQVRSEIEQRIAELPDEARQVAQAALGELNRRRQDAMTEPENRQRRKLADDAEKALRKYLEAKPKQAQPRERPSVAKPVVVTDAHRTAAEDFKQRLADPATVKEITKSLKNEKWATKEEQVSNLAAVLSDPQRLAERPSATYDSSQPFIPWAIAQAKLISQPSGTARKEAKGRKSLEEDKPQAFKGPRSVSFDVRQSSAGANDPVSPGEIERRLSATFDVPIRSGKVTGGALGIYKPDADVVRRIKQMYGQLGVTLHEVAHKIDAANPGLFAGASPAALNELKKLDYDQTKQRVFEGFAEFVRKRLTHDSNDPRSAERLAPEFTKHFDAFLAKSPQLSANVTEAKRLVDRYRSMSPQQRIEKQTRDDREPERPADEGVIERFRSKINDAWTKAVIDWKNPGHLIDLLDQAIEQVGYTWGANESKAHDIFDAMSNTGSQHAFRAIESGVHPIGANRSTKFGSGLLDAFEKAKLSPAEGVEWTNYFIAQHVNELATLKPDYNPGVRSDDAQRVLSDVSRDSAKQARYDELGQAVRDFNDDLIRMLGDSGVLSQAEVADILDAYEFYVPLERIADEKAFGRALRVMGLGGWLDVFKPVKARSTKGSGLPIVHPILSTILRAMRFYDAAIKQQVKQQMARQIDPAIGGVKGMGWLMERVPGDAQATKVQTEEAWRQIRRQLTAQGIDVSQVNPSQFPQMLTFWNVVAKADPANFIDRIMVDGQPVLYRMDPMLHYSLDQMSAPQLAAWQVLWRNFLTRPVKAGAVSLSTAFGGGNILNDWVQYQFTARSGRGLKSAADPFVELSRYVTTKMTGAKNELVELYDEFVGQINSRFGDGVRSPLDIKKKLMSAGQQQPVWTRLVHPVQTGSELLTKLEDAIAMTEVGPRMAEFEASLARNGFVLQNGRIVNSATQQPERPPQKVLLEATKSATETMPFKRRGHKAVAVGTMIPFFEAWMTGVGKFLQTHRAAYRGEGNARQRVILGHLLMAAATLAYWSLRKDDDDYKEQEQWLNKFFTWNGVRIPRGREWGATSMLVEGMLNSISDAESHTLSEELSETLHQFAPPMSPSGMPVAEAYFNYDLWRGKEIESQGVERLLPQDRVKPWTRPLARWIGSYTGRFGIGPLKVEFLMDRMTGGAAKRLQDTANDVATGDIKTSTVPFLGGVTLKHEYARTPDELYEKSKHESQVTASDKQNGTLNDKQYAKSYRLKEGAELVTEIRKLSSVETNEQKKTAMEKAAIGTARRFMGKTTLESYPDPFKGDIPSELKPIMTKWKQQLVLNASTDLSSEDITKAKSGKHRGLTKRQYDSGDDNDPRIKAARELLQEVAPTESEQRRLLAQAWVAKYGKPPADWNKFNQILQRLPAFKKR